MRGDVSGSSFRTGAAAQACAAIKAAPTSAAAAANLTGLNARIAILLGDGIGITVNQHASQCNRISRHGVRRAARPFVAPLSPPWERVAKAG